MRNPSLIPLLLTGTILAGCSLAPDFNVPEMTIPKLYKEETPGVSAGPVDEQPVSDQWRAARPMEEADRGRWWEIFGDEQLNELEKEALAANQSLKSAAARVEQSRELAESIAPSLIPDLDIGANALRSKPASARLASFGNPNAPQLKPFTLYDGQGVLSYEADLFGRVRDGYKAAQLDARAQEAAYRSAMLALQADVAQHYFSIRALDKERALLRDTVDIRTEANRIMQRRFEVGSVSEVDTTRTQSDLAGVKAELLLLDSQRRQLENALAVLLGKMPSEFMLEEAPLEGVPPSIPPGLPSKLLERRPDIASAIASMEAANRRIGVARSAFLPSLNLSATGGYQSTTFGDLFQWSSRTWALGQLGAMALSMPIFDSGRNLAELDASHAAYEAAVADYRQQVLLAFRDVEDNLTAQRLLSEQWQQQEAAASAASRTTELVGRRYDEGDVDYFQLVDAQRVSLMAERTAVRVQGQRYLATVALIRALGGGWDMGSVAPKKAQADASGDSAEMLGHMSSDVPVEPAGDPSSEAPMPIVAPGFLVDDVAGKAVDDGEKAEAGENEDGDENAVDVIEPTFFESEFGSGAVPKGETDEEILPDARLTSDPPVAQEVILFEGVPEESQEESQEVPEPAGEKQKDEPSSGLIPDRWFDSDLFDFDWDVDLGGDAAPAGEAAKEKPVIRGPLLGTPLDTAPRK